jgi:hypothetical protein
MGQPQVVYAEGEAGGGKSTLLSRFLGSLPETVVLQVGGDETETLLSYGVIDQLQPGVMTEPGTDPMVVGVRLLDLLDGLQSGFRPFFNPATGEWITCTATTEGNCGQLVRVTWRGPRPSALITRLPAIAR